MSQKCDFCNEVKDDKDMEKESYQGKSICKKCKEKEKKKTVRMMQNRGDIASDAFPFANQEGEVTGPKVPGE